MIEPEQFRHVVGHIPAGVTIVTTLRADGAPAGLTASAVCSASLHPTLVLACVDVGSESHRHIQQAGIFAVNVLDDRSGPDLARRFSTAGAAELKFHEVAHHAEQTGAPVLDQALAWLDCRVHGAHPAGDHTIFVGEVAGAGAREGAPLVYFRGRFGRLES